MQPERDYPVGYGKPPLHSRFKPGQSGNPRARPKADQDFGKLFSEALNDTVTVTTENGKRRKITKREAFVRQLVDRAAQGEPKAMAKLLRLMNEVARERKRRPPNRITGTKVIFPEGYKPPAWSAEDAD